MEGLLRLQKAESPPLSSSTLHPHGHRSVRRAHLSLDLHPNIPHLMLSRAHTVNCYGLISSHASAGLEFMTWLRADTSQYRPIDLCRRMWCLRAPGCRPNRPRRPRPSRKPPPPRPSARPASASRSAVPASRRSPRSRWRAMTSRSRSRDASRAGSSSPRAHRSAASARLAATFASDGYAFRRSSLHLRHPREAFRGREKRD